MTVLEINFQPKSVTKPAFDYPAFRAEYLRRKKMSSFERVKEDADRAHEQALADAAALVNVDGIPHWAEYQDAPGIMNTVHMWQAERFHDPNTMLCDERGIRIEVSGLVRYSNGLLERVKNIYSIIETYAIASIEGQSRIWVDARGRTYLTSEEFKLLNLSKRYMAEGDTFNFRVKYQGMEARYTESGTLVTEFTHRWISRMTGLSEWHIELTLDAIDSVYALRAQLGMDTAPEVRHVPSVQIISAKAA
jgi:hypothetical protein